MLLVDIVGQKDSGVDGEGVRVGEMKGWNGFLDRKYIREARHGLSSVQHMKYFMNDPLLNKLTTKTAAPVWRSRYGVLTDIRLVQRCCVYPC